MSRTRTIRVDYMTRVEGEGALFLKFAGDHLSEVQLRIFEPPRLFESFLRGRSFREVPDITARICGICPVAYQMSSVQAIEKALQVEPHPQVRELRRLLYCGEWIESHALHIYLLHAPDFLGYPDALSAAHDHPERVKLGLELKQTGNALVTLVGGREIHPISVCPGGFFRVPSRTELDALVPRLRRALDLAIDTTEWVAGFDFPDYEPAYDYVALRHPTEYPLLDGHLASTRGLDIPVEQYEDHFVEEHAPHSHALHSRQRQGGSYHVGPLARLNLNFDRLPPDLQALAARSGVAAPCTNPFRSIVARAVETAWACQEALRIIDHYQEPPEAAVAAEPRAGKGCAVTEAPRGILYHAYELDSQGLVRRAKITPPTAQNQRRMEDDLREVARMFQALPDPELAARCEQLVRNYDPCISCATHALKVRIERT